MSNLDQWSKIIENSGREREARVDKLTFEMGPPDFMEGEIGYWRITGGITSYKMSGRGLLVPESRTDFTDEFVTKLSELLKKEGR